jgi:hypothetical protein
MFFLRRPVQIDAAVQGRNDSLALRMNDLHCVLWIDDAFEDSSWHVHGVVRLRTIRVRY